MRLAGRIALRVGHRPTFLFIWGPLRLDVLVPGADHPTKDWIRHRMDVTEHLSQIITPTIEGMGYELVRVHLTGGARPILQVMAERQDGGGMTVDDCADISRAVAAVLDVEDPLPTAYTLEVSSPGIDQPLTRLKDFARNVGMAARVETGELVEGRKRFVGRIQGVEGDIVLLTLEPDAGKPAKSKAPKTKQRKRKSAESSLAEPMPARAAAAESVTEKPEEAEAPVARIPFAAISRAKLLLTPELLKRAAEARAGAAPGTEGGEMEVEDRPRRSRRDAPDDADGRDA